MPWRQTTTRSALLAGVSREVAYSPTGADRVQLIRKGAAELPQTIVEAAATTTTMRIMLLAVVPARRARYAMRWLLAIVRGASIPAVSAASGVPS